MAEYPILFNTDAVRALHRGEKTQTRRLITRHAPEWIDSLTPGHPGHWRVQTSKDTYLSLLSGTLEDQLDFCKRITRTFCPYGVPGDYLYTREKFAIECPYGPEKECGNPDHVVYWATESWVVRDSITVPWRASIHMPRWASRDWLPIIDIQVERIQSITDEDAKAEGILCGLHEWDCLFSKNWGHAPLEGCCHCGDNSPSEVYQRYWGLIHPGSWERNDWVFKIEWGNNA